MAEHRPFCDWCHNPMIPVDAVETGMYRGIGLVWLCTHPDCGHEVERSIQYTWERLLLKQFWRTRLVQVLWVRAVDELVPEPFSDDEWDEWKPAQPAS